MIQLWEERFVGYLQTACAHNDDASHDLAHFRRVFYTAKRIAEAENEASSQLVLLASSYLHDLVTLPKNHPERHLSSLYASQQARELLCEMEFPQDKIEAVCHAIHAHSFSANIAPQSLEAKIVQDADRMEALGALGIMRCFYTNGRLGTAPYHVSDLFGHNRQLDDRQYAVDHFFCKLFKLKDLFQTESGKKLARQREQFLWDFLWALEADLQGKDRGALFLLNTYVKSGKCGSRLFHPDDPFAEGRVKEPELYALDEILDHKNAQTFLMSFLNQLKDEISLKNLEDDQDAATFDRGIESVRKNGYDTFYEVKRSLDLDR